MGEKSNLKFLGIVLCLALGTILFAFQACKRDQPPAYKPGSLGRSAPDGLPSWSPDGQKIAFISNRDGNMDIFTMETDGSNQTRLTDNSASDLTPSWSPDGTKIAFVSDRDGNQEIYSMDVDGSNLKRLTNDPSVERAPRWSPDGTRIAFYSNRDGNFEIYIMNTDGSDQMRCTDNPAADGWPSWTPDGSKIVFHSNRDGNYDIYIMNADGTDQTRLTENPSDDFHAFLSLDGKKIAFVSERDGNEEIYTMNTDGSNQIRCTDNHGIDDHPSWSPDGQKIAFISQRDFDAEIYVMDADGSNPVNLTNNAPVDATFGLKPLPRSDLDLDEIPYKIVFESYRETDGKENWEICLIDADGSNLINLTNTPEIDEMYPHASPDGRRICFEAVEGEERESKSRNVYTMNIDGTDRVKIVSNANQPCWSPDGRYIAYLPGEYPRYNPNIDANKGLEIYDFETGEVMRHPNDEIQHIWSLGWSPDGKWFVAAGGPITAYKVNDKTTMVIQTSGCTPDIGPGGKSLVWNGTDYSLNIGAVDFDSPEIVVTEQRIVVACERDHWIYFADWTPDKKYLAFSYAPQGAGRLVGMPSPGSNICICDLSTGKWTQITTDGKHNKSPDWVPVKVQ